MSCSTWREGFCFSLVYFAYTHAKFSIAVQMASSNEDPNKLTKICHEIVAVFDPDDTEGFIYTCGIANMEFIFRYCPRSKVHIVASLFNMMSTRTALIDDNQIAKGGNDQLFRISEVKDSAYKDWLIEHEMCALQGPHPTCAAMKQVFEFTELNISGKILFDEQNPSSDTFDETQFEHRPTLCSLHSPLLASLAVASILHEP